MHDIPNQIVINDITYYLLPIDNGKCIAFALVRRPESVSEIYRLEQEMDGLFMGAIPF